MRDDSDKLTEADIESFKESGRFFERCRKVSERKKKGVSKLEAYLEDIAEQRAAIMAAEKLEEMARDLRADAAALERYMEKERVEEETFSMKMESARKLIKAGGLTHEQIAECVNLPLSVVQSMASEKDS